MLIRCTQLAKEWAKAFYNSDAWRTCRDVYARSAGWLCEECYRKGIYTPGKIVHHKTCLTRENITNPEITFGFDNLELVCQDCHNKIHTKEKKERYLFDSDGNVIEI